MIEQRETGKEKKDRSFLSKGKYLFCLELDNKLNPIGGGASTVYRKETVMQF